MQRKGGVQVSLLWDSWNLTEGRTVRCHLLQRHFTHSWIGHLLVTGLVLHYLHQMESLLTEIFEVVGDAEIAVLH